MNGPPAEEVAALLRAKREELSDEVSALAEPIRAPGVQVQFGKRAGDHTSDAVMQTDRAVTAGKLAMLAAEIDRALDKLAEGSYGRCDICGGQIPPERLEALPWTAVCVSCRGGGAPGSGRRGLGGGAPGSSRRGLGGGRG